GVEMGFIDVDELVEEVDSPYAALHEEPEEAIEVRGRIAALRLGGDELAVSAGGRVGGAMDTAVGAAAAREKGGAVAVNGKRPVRAAEVADDVLVKAEVCGEIDE